MEALGQFCRIHAKRVAKASFGALVVGAGIWALVRTFVLSISTRAVVGGSVTVIAAPIEGMLDMPGLSPGQLIEPGTVLATISNARADETFVRELEGRLEAAEAGIATLSPLLAELENIASGLSKGAEAYQQRRVAQLRFLLEESRAKFDADRAEAREATDRLHRTLDLSKAGLASGETRAAADRDAEVANQRALAAQVNLEGVHSQLEAAQAGVNIDASGMGTDRPYSKQRLDEVRLDLLRWKQRSDEQHKARDALHLQLERARARWQELAYAELPVPKRSRVWQVSSTGKAFITKGQPLVSVLACDSLVVVALVNERVFNKLRIGSGGLLKLRESGAAFRGQVRQLKGLADGTADVLATPGLVPSSDDRYRVILHFPQLVDSLSGECTVGHSGEVHFD